VGRLLSDAFAARSCFPVAGHQRSRLQKLGVNWKQVVLTDVDRRAQRIPGRGRLILQFPVPVKGFVMVEDCEGYDATVSKRPLGILSAREVNLLVDEGCADPAAYSAAKEAYTRVPFQLGGEGYPS